MILPTLDIRHLLRKMCSHMRVWNKIPAFFREAKTIHTFKKQFKNYLLDQQNKLFKVSHTVRAHDKSVCLSVNIYIIIDILLYSYIKSNVCS